VTNTLQFSSGYIDNDHFLSYPITAVMSEGTYVFMYVYTVDAKSPVFEIPFWVQFQYKPYCFRDFSSVQNIHTNMHAV